jgi:hypothetical protein
MAEEVTGQDSATDRRKSANFPTGKTFSSWHTEDSSIPEATQNALSTLEWIERPETSPSPPFRHRHRQSHFVKPWPTPRSRPT